MLKSLVLSVTDGLPTWRIVPGGWMLCRDAVVVDVDGYEDEWRVLFC